MKRLLAVMLAILLLAGIALGEKWEMSEENRIRFRTLFDQLETASGSDADRAAIDAQLEDIRLKSEDDYQLGRAVTDHWYSTVLDSRYRMFVHRGEKTAAALERSGLDFSGKHAFIVLGFKLENGEMVDELVGRCDAAAAAAASYPEAILITTGGATGTGNPYKHTEAGEMKKYLTEHWGIDPDRIFTETDALTTLENAENTFRILEENGIETFTLVTSNYHQMWAQVLFNAKTATYEKETGYKVRILGNYNYQARPAIQRKRNAKTGLNQLTSLFGADR